MPSAVAGFRVSNSITAAAAVVELCPVLWPGLGFPNPLLVINSGVIEPMSWETWDGGDKAEEETSNEKTDGIKP